MLVLALLEAERLLRVRRGGRAVARGAARHARAFAVDLIALRPYPGQAVSAGRLRAVLEGREIRESHRKGDPRLQDAYSLRCMPQVHGAAREAFAYVRRILEVEINSATDNPLVFPESGAIKSGGNFHAPSWPRRSTSSRSRRPTSPRSPSAASSGSSTPTRRGSTPSSPRAPASNRA